MSNRKCAKCGKQGVKLYRAYGEFLRDDRIFCQEHVNPDSWGWYIPLIEDTDGTVWGYTSSPLEAVKRWEALPGKYSATAGWNPGKKEEFEDRQEYDQRGRTDRNDSQ